jgi:hypothetical protein
VAVVVGVFTMLFVKQAVLAAAGASRAASWLVDHRITGSPRWRTGYPATYPAAMKCLLADSESLTAYLWFPAEHYHRSRLRRRRRPSRGTAGDWIGIAQLYPGRRAQWPGITSGLGRSPAHSSSAKFCGTLPNA